MMGCFGHYETVGVPPPTGLAKHILRGTIALRPDQP